MRNPSRERKVWHWFVSVSFTAKLGKLQALADRSLFRRILVQYLLWIFATSYSWRVTRKYWKLPLCSSSLSTSLWISYRNFSRDLHQEFLRWFSSEIPQDFFFQGFLRGFRPRTPPNFLQEFFRGFPKAISLRMLSNFFRRPFRRILPGISSQKIFGNFLQEFLRGFCPEFFLRVSSRNSFKDYPDFSFRNFSRNLHQEFLRWFSPEIP